MKRLKTLAVDPYKLATSKSIIRDEGRIIFTLQFSLPYDVYGKGSFWLGTSGSFETKVFDFQAHLTPFDGAFISGELRHCIFNMSPFELVNEHQWSGSQPTQINQWSKARGDYKIGSERPLWGISGFDAARGQRILAGISHAEKDSVFTVQYRLNMMLEYVRGLIKPYENEVRENFKAKRALPEGTPETHPEQHEMMHELRAAYQDSKPHWEF